MEIFKKQKTKHQKGTVLVFLIIVLSVFSILMLPLLDNVILKLNILRTAIDREKALQIAEAGVNYYQWHLAHFPTDYETDVGLHNYIDADTQEVVGQFSLVVTPPPVGSTVVTIQSTGWTNTSPNVNRTITVQFGNPSLTKYAFLSHWHIWVYPTDTINGRFMANNGVRFEGEGNAPIQSAKETYICPYSDGCAHGGEEKPGIWGNPAPSQATQNFWQFPVPSVDFSALTSTLSDMKDLADDGGVYLPPSGEEGYSLVFNSDGTITIYKVTSRINEPTAHGWVYDVWKAFSESSDYENRTILSGYDHKPLSEITNGIIFAEDDLWVEGTVRGRITVATAKLGETNLNKMPTVYIPNHILYSNKDGSDVLGLISQGDIIYSFYSPTDLEVDAAQIAQNGGTQVLYYGSGHSCPRGNSCTYEYPYIKNSITTYGSIMTYNAWVWTWSNEAGDTFFGGYMQTYNNYDPNLLYAPPPSFPLSTSGYQQFNWTSD
ncbi:MAG: hypothetical protein Q8Q48_00775 [Candidatus Staskawiczbacteria bacterium]|nr:hypothetical protein [Candidatus Staskawiczbacteria bacterium]